MNRKKTLSILIVSIMILSTSVLFFPSIIANQVCTVDGYVYIDDVIMEPDQIILSFPEQDIKADLWDDGFYIVDFAEEVGTHFYKSDLIWLVRFPSDESYHDFTFKGGMDKLKIHGIFPISDLKKPEAVQNLIDYKRGRSHASMYLKEAMKNKGKIEDDFDLTQTIEDLVTIKSRGKLDKHIFNMIKNFTLGIGLNGYCMNNTILANCIWNTSQYGIMLWNHCENNYILGSNLTNYDRGIVVLNRSSNNTIIGNTITNSTSIGVHFNDHSNDNLIQSNKIFNTLGSSFDIGENCSNNIIKENTVIN